MTSVLKRYAQMDPRTQYFYVINTVTGYKNTLPVQSLMADTDFNAAFTIGTPITVSYNTGNLLKDLGRSITVYSTTTTGSPHVAIFREVMQVQGLHDEGIGSGISSYICTWVDYGPPGPGFAIYTLASVARTG